jgi:dTDP-4-dehydrorhamnose 3,5-epimerase
MVLITGGARFIGSNLVHYWIDTAKDVAIHMDVLTYAGNYVRPPGRRRLPADNHGQPWVPPGFLVRSDIAGPLYKTTEYYASGHERGVAWNDPAVGIDWPVEGEPVLSAKDKVGLALREAEVFA